MIVADTHQEDRGPLQHLSCDYLSDTSVTAYFILGSKRAMQCASNASGRHQHCQDICVVSPRVFLVACWLFKKAGSIHAPGLPLQRREGLGLPPGDADPFFELSNGAPWEVRSPCPSCVALTVPITSGRPGFSGFCNSPTRSIVQQTGS